MPAAARDVVDADLVEAAAAKRSSATLVMWSAWSWTVADPDAVLGARPHHHTHPSISGTRCHILAISITIVETHVHERCSTMEPNQQAETASRARHRDPRRRGVDRRHVRGLLTVTRLLANRELGVRPRPRLAAAPPGGGAARAVRGAAVSLRHAQAVVPEEPDDRRGGQLARRPPRRPVRLPRRRNRRRRSRRRTCTPSACWSQSKMLVREGELMTTTDRARPCPRAGRPVRARPRRADLPDVGADLRLQSVVRALPVVVGQARSARAVAPSSARTSSTSSSACRCST